MIGLLIYFIGVIVSYIVGRKVIRGLMGKYYDYGDVLGILLLSTTSWFGVVIFTIMSFVFTIMNFVICNNKPKKWM